MDAHGAAGSSDGAAMDHALSLARRGLGRVAPNPSVGCVIMREGRVVGRGWTNPDGRHAETMALQAAGESARGAVAYVTLEPCAHHGKTPPCADALIDAGVSRVVGSCLDPDPRVSGAGYRRLREAGVQVEDSTLAAARAVNVGYMTRLEKGRPWVRLKLAASLDGRIGGSVRQITGPAAQARVQVMRAQSDAVMVGVMTALNDDPRLTCRLPGLEDRSPIRIVADSRLRLPLTSRLVRSAAEVPLWVLARTDVDGDRRAAFESCGVEVIPVSPGPGGLDMEAALALLGERGITRLMVEGGAFLATTLFAAGLVDSVDWFAAPRLLGSDGIAALGSFAGCVLEPEAMAPVGGSDDSGGDVLISCRVRG